MTDSDVYVSIGRQTDSNWYKFTQKLVCLVFPVNRQKCCSLKNGLIRSGELRNIQYLYSYGVKYKGVSWVSNPSSQTLNDQYLWMIVSGKKKCTTNASTCPVPKYHI